MGVTHPVFTEWIEGPAEAIFDLVADMPNYGRWLPGSDAFGGTTQVEPYPVRLGTRYLDGGPLGERPGEVTEYDRPRHLGFHHTMSVRRGPLRAEIDVRIRYTLEPQAGAAGAMQARVIRALDMAIEMPWWARAAEPLVVRAFQKENVRILAELKKYVEGTRKASGKV